jgi:ferredoxin
VDEQSAAPVAGLVAAKDGAETPRGDEKPLFKVTCLDRAGTEMATLEVPGGTVLLRALEPIGFVVGRCGGYGGCGACAVELDNGRTVQSCFVTVERDMTVRRIRYR